MYGEKISINLQKELWWEFLVPPGKKLLTLLWYLFLLNDFFFSVFWFVCRYLYLQKVNNFQQVPTKIKLFGRGTKEKVVATRVQAGSHFSMALTAKKEVYSWGYSGLSFLIGQRLFFFFLLSSFFFLLLSSSFFFFLDSIINAKKAMSNLESEDRMLFLKTPKPIPNLFAVQVFLLSLFFGFNFLCWWILSSGTGYKWEIVFRKDTRWWFVFLGWRGFHFFFLVLWKKKRRAFVSFPLFLIKSE